MPLTKAETEQRCGFSIPDTIWNYHPWGHRIVARRLNPEEKYGEIIIPDSFKRLVSAGTIVRVGTCVGEMNGLPGQTYVPDRFMKRQVEERGGWIADPDLLVGTVITFGKFVGEEIHVDSQHALTERTYDDSQFILLQAVDILGHNDPLESGEEGNEDVSGTKEG